MKLDGKVAVVTGGGGAMGGAQCELFAREGAAVCVADLFLDKAEVVAERIRASGGQAISWRSTFACRRNGADVVSATEGAFGHVTILVNNAGANFRVSFDDQTEEMWRMILNTILTGSFLGTKAVVPSMRRAGGGVIVNLGSLASVRSGGGSPAYGAAKTGLVALTRSTAASYAADHIRCVLISPGHVDTPFIRANASYSPNDERTSIDNPENYQRRVAATPLGRLVTPEDVAQSMLFVVVRRCRDAHRLEYPGRRRRRDLAA